MEENTDTREYKSRAIFREYLINWAIFVIFRDFQISQVSNLAIFSNACNFSWNVDCSLTSK